MNNENNNPLYQLDLQIIMDNLRYLSEKLVVKPQ